MGSKGDKVKFQGKYHYGTGRRKESVAQVRIYPNHKKMEVMVNGRDYLKYFPTLELRKTIEDCFRVTGFKGMGVSVVVRGGGTRGQAESIRHGIARALVDMDEKLKQALRDSGYLTRDPRKKERKKPGLKKARRAPQWQKR